MSMDIHGRKLSNGGGATPIFRILFVLPARDPAKSLKLVELRGIEPLTSAVRLQRSPI